MPNPYDSSNNTSPPPATIRPVRRYVLAALLLGVFALFVSAPGLFLLNQDLQILPASTFVGGFEANGQPVPTSRIIWVSLSVAATVWSASVCLAILAYGNHCKNRIVRRIARRIAGEVNAEPWVAAKQ